MDDEQKVKVAEKIVEGILADIKGRQGIGDEIDQIDEDIYEQMVDDFILIAVKELP